MSAMATFLRDYYATIFHRCRGSAETLAWGICIGVLAAWYPSQSAAVAAGTAVLVLLVVPVVAMLRIVVDVYRKRSVNSKNHS